MATEAPFISHTQCTASVDMSAAASLAGANSSGQFLAVKISGARTVAPAAANTDLVHGILQNDPKSGQAANVCVFGVCKAMAGAAITAGAQLMAKTDGTVITATTPGTNPTLGQAIEASTAGAQVITVLVAPGFGLN